MYTTKVTLHNARKYGYANARVRARVASMLSRDTMQQIINAKDISSALVILMQTDYREDIEHYGGMEMRAEMLDFALNRNLGRTVGALLNIVPKDDVDAITSITRGWEVSNVELALEAKSQGKSFDSISKYLINFRKADFDAIESSMAEVSMEEMVKRLIKDKTYPIVLKELDDALRAGKKLPLAEFDLERAHIERINACIDKVGESDKDAAMIMWADIMRRNVMMALRAKRRKMPLKTLELLLINEDTEDMRKLKALYAEHDGFEDFVSSIKMFGLNSALAAYKKKKQLIIFDIHMKNRIFREWREMLRRSMLSLGTVMAYAYAKEIEVYRLRDAIKTKEYQIEPNLSAEMLNA